MINCGKQQNDGGIYNEQHEKTNSISSITNIILFLFNNETTGILHANRILEKIQ